MLVQKTVHYNVLVPASAAVNGACWEVSSQGSFPGLPIRDFALKQQPPPHPDSDMLAISGRFKKKGRTT